MIKEHDIVTLKEARPQDGLEKGARGTVILATPGNPYVMVEFLNSDGETIADPDLHLDEVELYWTVEQGYVRLPKAA